MRKFSIPFFALLFLNFFVSIVTFAQTEAKQEIIIKTPRGYKIEVKQGNKTQIKEVIVRPGTSSNKKSKPAAKSALSSGAISMAADASGSCPDDITINNDARKCGAVVNYTTPTSTCIPKTLTQSSSNDFTGGYKGDNCAYRFFRAYDLPALGIIQGFTVSSVDFGVGINEGGKPVTVNIYQWDPSTDLSYANFTLVKTTAADIGNPNFTVVNQPVSAFIPAGYAMIVEIEGNGGDISSFYIAGNQDPQTGLSYYSATCDANQTIHSDNDLYYVINPNGCAAGQVTQTAGLASGSFFSAGTTTNTFQFTDGSSCSFNVTVTDNESPTFTAPPDQNVALDANCSIIVPDLTAGLTGSDNCGSVTFNQDPVNGTVVGSGHNQTTQISITAQDSHGNKTLQSVTLTAKDVTKPTITAPADVNVNTDAGKCSAGSVNLGTPTYGDNCSGATVSNDAPATFPKGTTTVTYTVTDGANNTATATQKVMVTDNEKPVVTCPVIPVQCYKWDCKYIIPVLTATDNCGITTVKYTITGATKRNGTGYDASGTFNIGTSTITWTVTDGSNNQSTCSSSVTVNKPLFVSIPDAKAECKGVEENTVYKGYTPASSITLTGKAIGGSGSFTFKWNTGATTSYIKVSPALTTTYTVTITDGKNCTATVCKTVKVEDVRCDNGKKVEVRQKSGKKYNTLCVASKDVEKYLDKGAYLGSCKISKRNIKSEDEVPEVTGLTLKASPNPTSGYFNLTINSTNVTDKVTIRVIDAIGRLVELKTATAGQTVQIGASYIHGMYFAQAVQGSERVTVKLVKQ